MGLSGTLQQQLVFLNTHWGTASSSSPRLPARMNCASSSTATSAGCAPMTADDEPSAPQTGGGQPAAACRAVGGRLRPCPHVPACPPPQARDRQAARVVVSHPEQGWGLLCNGVMVFDDTGALLPSGSAIEPDRSTRQPAMSTMQAGHGRTVAPVAPGRARAGRLRGPGPVMAGATLSPSPSPCEVSGPRQEVAQLQGWRVSPASPGRPAAQRKTLPDAW
jgi:Family of unknown function (DUF5999)